MSHVKNSKRRGSKKTSISSANPLAAAEAALAAQPPSLPSETKKSRSRSQSAIQIVPPAASDNEKQPSSGRRRAATKVAEIAPPEISPDVFQFLDKDESDAVAKARKISGGAPLDYPGSTRPVPKDGARKVSSHSFRSDSGISVRDHSPGRSSSIVSRESSEFQPATPPDVHPEVMNWSLSPGLKKHRVPGGYLTDTESMLDGPTSHAPAYLDTVMPESFYFPKRLQPAPKVMPKRPNLITATSKSTVSSRRLSLDSISPTQQPTTPEPRPCIYRKFENLNHRILQSLQEEIMQLEDDLTTLDELEAAHQASPGARSSPRQKLLAAKYQDLQIQDYSVLQFKRSDLLEKIASKTEKYNRALCSFREHIQSLPSASSDEIDSYDHWLQANPSSSKVERRILDHRSDLVLLTSRSGNSNQPNPIYTTIAGICAAILFPLLAFGAISEFYGRIVVVAIIGGMIALWASNGPPGNYYLIDPRDGWKCAMIYFGFMSFAAIIIS